VETEVGRGEVRSGSSDTSLGASKRAKTWGGIGECGSGDAAGGSAVSEGVGGGG